MDNLINGCFAKPKGLIFVKLYVKYMQILNEADSRNINGIDYPSFGGGLHG